MSGTVIPFRTVIDVVKAVEEDGNKYLIGESSGPEIDLEEQFMTKPCIEDMAEQINARPVPYLNEHSGRKVGDQLGDVIEASVTPEWHLRTRTLLDPVNPIAMMLWDKVRAGKQYGQSVAGHALEYAKKSLDDGKKVLKGFARIKLNHVANTTKPTWQHGFGTMVAKSQDWGDIEWGDVDEYEGDIPFFEKAATPAKRTSAVKADPKAGKKAVVVDTLQKLLSMLAAFDWKSYAEYAKTLNKDDITLGPAPETGDVSPVGTYAKPPADADVGKSYDEADVEWLEYVEKAVPDVGDLESVLDAYNRLCCIAKALPEEGLRQKVEETATAMAGVFFSEPGPQEVKTYNEDVIITKSGQKASVGDLACHLEVEAVNGLDGYLERVEKSGGQVLKSFGQVDTGVGRVDLERVQRPIAPPIKDGVLKSFDQVASPGVQQEAVMSGDLGVLFQSFLEEVKKADGTIQEKQALIQEVGGAMIQKAQEQVAEAAPEEQRVGAWIQKAVVPVLEALNERLDSIEGQLALVRSGSDDPPPSRGRLVRKSIDPGVRPSRVVTNKKATFQGLVRGDQYMDTEVGG